MDLTVYPLEIYNILRDMMNLNPIKRPDPKVVWDRLILLEKKILEGGDDSD